MAPLSWPELHRIHPFAPADQQAGYAELCADLERWLCEITGFAAVSLQPNSREEILPLPSLTVMRWTYCWGT